MLSYVYLAVAIGSEVVGTLALRFTRGFTVFWPSVLVVVAYAVAFFMLSLVLRTIPVGVAYAIWSGVGTAIVAVAGAAFFRERLGLPAVLGIVMIVAGVVLLELSTSSGGAESGAAG